jgi:mycothiol synthase
MSVVEWEAECAGELAALVAAALPDEGLTQDELRACCWDGAGRVLALAGGDGAVSVCLRVRDERRLAYVRLLAVAPDAQGRGHGRRLLEAAHEWAFGTAGADEIQVGGSAPFYLWPGVDVRWLPALALFESAGYTPLGAALNLRCSVATGDEAKDGSARGGAGTAGGREGRSVAGEAVGTLERPAGRGPIGAVSLRRLLAPDDVHAVVGSCAEHWPHWQAELERGIERGTAHGAFAPGGDFAGFGCHSVNRAGWIGPLATHPAHRRQGVAAALMAALLRDLAAAGHSEAEIAWAGSLGFYARTVDARVSRVFRTLSRAPTKTAQPTRVHPAGDPAGPGH